MKECAIIPKFMMLQKRSEEKNNATHNDEVHKKNTTLHEKQKRLF